MPAPKSVLITGCSSGIGRCLALRLAEHGYQVFASARRESDVESLIRQGLDAHQLDLSSSASIERAVAEILARTGGRMYALINNGAYGQQGAVEDLSREALRAQLETNLLGTHDLTTKLIPVFRTQGHGRIVQISSILGLVCLAYRGAYNASKYALEALSDTLRLELRGTGVYVSLIEPGPIGSRFRANALTHFEANIDSEKSVHRATYRRVRRRLQQEKDPPFTLPPDAVLKPVVHALQSQKPRIRYRVTLPAHVLARLKRWLPDRWLDRIILQYMGQ